MSLLTRRTSPPPATPRGAGRQGATPAPTTWWQKLFTSHEALDDAAAEQAAVATGCVTACTIQPREYVSVLGVLQSVTILPATTQHWLEAELWDGSGRALTLMWIGRQRIPGITVGARLRVSGRVAEQRGRLVMFNPKYELMPPVTR